RHFGMHWFSTLSNLTNNKNTSNHQNILKD
ncbi:unnamed protein product, partial [Hermetia illucens]